MGIISGLFGKSKYKETPLNKNKNKSKYNISLGICPATWFVETKPIFEILSIQFMVMDGKGDNVHITIQHGQKVQSIFMSTYEAKQLGFINPNAIEVYCKSMRK